MRRDSGNTSVDSLMDDTPSNYNIANQRFDPNLDYEVEDIIEEEEDDGRGGRRLKKRRKKRPQELVQPDDKDMALAKAYGGVPRGKPKRPPAPRDATPGHKGSRNVTTPGQMGNHKDRLNRIANSISGYHDDPRDEARLQELRRDQMDNSAFGD